jgi:hypothetical protein
VLFLAACSARQGGHGSGAVLFDGRVDQLLPLHAGDSFLYRASGGRRGERLAWSRVTAMEQAGDLVVSVTEGETAVSYTHLRLQADAVALVGELDVAGDLGIRYATPPPLVATPLRDGEQHVRSAIEVFRASDGLRLGDGAVDVTLSSSRDAGGDFAVHVRRHLSLPDRDVTIDETRWLRPGVGEVRSEAGVNGVVVDRRELVCAVIAGKQVGTCPGP